MAEQNSTPRSQDVAHLGGSIVQVQRVQGEALSSLFRFRRCIFCDELGWLSPDPGAPFELRDHFDETAYNYAAFSADGSVVGSVRVVPDSPLGLPIERNVTLNGLRERARLAEISRLAVTRALRGTDLALLLMKAAYECARHTGHEYLVLDTYVEDKNQSIGLYTRMGFEPLGAAYFDPSYKCPLPVIALGLDCPRAERILGGREPGLHRSFCVIRDPRILHEPKL